MIKRLSDQKWLFVVSSILLATVFWYYVRQVEDYVSTETIRGVSVVLSGENVLENQSLTVSSISQSTVDLKIRANISVLDELSRQNMTVTVDVSKCSEEGEYELTYTVNFPSYVNTSGVSVESRSSQYITVTVDKLHAETFSVELMLRGSVAEGYQAGTPTFNHDTVLVSGAIEQVSQVSQVVAILEHEMLSARYSGELPLVLLDSEGTVLTDLDVKLSETAVYVTLPIVVVREIPLIVNFIEGGGATEANVASVVISPKSITVSGAEEDMLTLTELSLGSIDLSKVNGKSTTTFPINLDPSLENISGISDATVTVTISGLETRALDVSNIELIHVPDGYTVKVDTQVRTIIVRGSAEALETLDASQVRIVADLTGISVIGTTSVPARTYLDAANGIGVVGEYSIVVTISRR